jgi:predicted enzyme related to lactoylglutathione lyase
MATGDVCHIELSTTALSSSREFYRQIFGWTFEDVPGMDGYVLFRTPSGLGGGLSAGPNAEPPSAKGPILHIEVDDIDATLKKIVERGGKLLVPRTKISDEFGYFALFLDNVGNRLGLWSSS